MLAYTITVTEGERPVPVVVFEDKSYDLIGSFLLAERSFRREILSAVNEVDLGISERASFSGNAFSLAVTPQTSKITDDLHYTELTVDTEDFKQLLLEYIYQLREINVRNKLKHHSHDGGHHHH